MDVNMNVLEFKNNQKIKRADIPVVDFESFSKKILPYEVRVINLFVKKENDKNRLYCIFADDKNKKLFLTTTYVGESYPSLTLSKPCLHMFERLIYEETGIMPEGHPFLKPVRKQDGNTYKFLESHDIQTHEVAVGPVHAGIIEPGHFRFLCNGERVNHLEIQLGFQHRGVEDLLKKRPSIQLAESICGDETIAQSLAYARAMESLSNIEITQREKIIRLIALEMERMAIHVGDIGAVAGDVAYSIGANVLGVTRTLVINTMLELSGSRFGKGLMKFGGVNFDIDLTMRTKILNMLEEVCDRTDKMVEAMFAHATVISRLENTGFVGKKKAREIGLVGMAARAAGEEFDARVFDDYEDFEITTMKTGDVYARTYLRYLEIKKSAQIIKNMLNKLEDTETEINNKRFSLNLEPDCFVFSIVEGWRGEVAHCVMTDKNSYIETYKIKGASFNNWFGLALAVRNNQISDFPVCNKSFNLSYCGFDL